MVFEMLSQECVAGEVVGNPMNSINGCLMLFEVEPYVAPKVGVEWRCWMPFKQSVVACC